MCDLLKFPRPNTFSCVCSSGTLQELISHTTIHWAQESFIQNPELVRMMFSLLHRQYDGLGELIRALPKAYTINAVSINDTMDLLECLGQIRSLLIVQMGPEEERLMIQSIGWISEFGYIHILKCVKCLKCRYFFHLLQKYHEQQSFLSTPQLDASAWHARDGHGGHG